MLVSNGALVADSYGDQIPSYAGVQQHYYGGTGLPLTDTFASYGAVYKANLWVATLVNKIAYGTARLPLKVYERQSDGSRNEARDTPFARLIRNPNPRHDPFFFWLWTVSTFEVYGEAMWVKVRPRRGAAPVQLWPMHPANVTTYRRSDDGVLMYRFVYGSKDQSFLEWPSDDVVHFKTYNPSDQVRGLSRLEPLRQTILSEDAIGRAQSSFWRNGARPSVILSHPKEFRGPAAERIARSWSGVHSGVDSWSKTAVLEEGMTAQVVSLNAAELQMIDSRKVNREEACGIYDVPPPVVHILDRATFSNITEQMRSLYRDTMAPRLGLFESVLDASLRPDFDPQGRLYAEFLLDEVLRGAFEQRATANQSAIFSGQRTPNEARRQDNLPPLEGGDRLYINAGAIPLGDAAQGEGTTPAGPPVSVRSIESAETKGVAVVGPCVECQSTESRLSVRGLCRSCEGKAARSAAREEFQ